MDNLSKLEGAPTGIEGVTFLEIQELFANSSYGKKLRGAIRYAPFKPKEVSNERWLEILGPDVSNLEHLKFTFDLTQNFIHLVVSPHKEWPFKNGAINLNKEEQELLCLTALIHDWGEAVVGDIPWGDKNSSHAETELKILRQ